MALVEFGPPTIEKDLKFICGRNNINKVGKFSENWDCPPFLATGAKKNCALFRKMLPSLILKI